MSLRAWRRSSPTPSLRSTCMCGRYTTAADRVKFDDIFKPAAVDQAVEKAVGRYNVAPTQQVAIIERTAEDGRRATTARWSLVPRWAKSIKERPQWINARSDKVLTSKLWRSLAARPEGRILISADGWYEWMHAEQQRGGPKPAPFHHRVDDGGWFAFAGLQSRLHRFDSGRRLWGLAAQVLLAAIRACPGCVPDSALARAEKCLSGPIRGIAQAPCGLHGVRVDPRAVRGGAGRACGRVIDMPPWRPKNPVISRAFRYRAEPAGIEPASAAGEGSTISHQVQVVRRWESNPRTYSRVCGRLPPPAGRGRWPGAVPNPDGELAFSRPPRTRLLALTATALSARPASARGRWSKTQPTRTLLGPDAVLRFAGHPSADRSRDGRRRSTTPPHPPRCRLDCAGIVCESAVACVSSQSSASGRG